MDRREAPAPDLDTKHVYRMLTLNLVQFRTPTHASFYYTGFGRLHCFFGKSSPNDTIDARQ